MTDSADSSRNNRMSLDRWRQALAELTPLERYHAGPGMTAAYDGLRCHYPGVELIAYRTGDRVGTWTVPAGWVVHHGRLTDPQGRVIADHAVHPLHLFAYSPSFSGPVPLEELQAHLMSDPSRPDAIPFHFRNQYRPWAAEWGFCLAHRDRERLVEGTYHVDIRTEFVETDMLLGLQSHEGEHADCLLLVGHFDHPAQAGDGLVGCLAGHEVLSRMAGRRTRLTYRMLSTVEMVGSVFYADRRARADGVREALFSAMSGVRGPLVYSRSAHETAAVDRAMAHVLKHCGEPWEAVGFREAVGNDEIAFDVHGVDIPCGSLMRWPHPDYHTDRDTAESMGEAQMEAFIRILQRVIDIFENNALLTGRFMALPQLSHPDTDLYLSPTSMSGVVLSGDPLAQRLMARLPDEAARAEARAAADNLNLMMSLLPPLADGRHTTLDIAERSGVPFAVVDAYTDLWREKGLLDKTWINPFAAGKSAS